jgi:hypothetical protein
MLNQAEVYTSYYSSENICSFSDLQQSAVPSYEIFVIKSPEQCLLCSIGFVKGLCLLCYTTLFGIAPKVSQKSSRIEKKSHFWSD